jgi:RNA polymerase sigma-70 factor (ECF subfamily)
MQQQQDDISIIQEVLKGKQQAYTLLVEKYQGYVFTLVLRYVTDRNQAEEVAQDVFVKAYRCLADFKGNSKFSTWLYAIVHTTCLSHLRKKRDETVLLENDQLLSAAMHLQSHDGADNKLEQKNRKQLLEKAIATLSAEDAQVITLFYLADQSLEEIGKITGVPAATVKARLFRARQRLRTLLETKFINQLT